jgi:hypothetical protein
MENNNLVSLRHYRAKKLCDVYFALPSSHRTKKRAAKLIEAIFDYAYENVPRHRRKRSGRLHVSPGESKRISRRLEEFVFPGAASDPDSLMNWLHANLIPEAWTYPEDLRGFIQDCLVEA